MSYTSNHHIFKAKAKVVMDAASPTIFIAALIGVGVPILLGWIGGEDGSLFNFTFHNVQDFDLHDLPYMMRSAWGQLRAAVGGLFIGLFALWALLFGLVVSSIKAILNYGFVDYMLRAFRGELGQPQDVLVGFRIPVRVLIAHVLKQVVIWLCTLCLFIPGFIAGYSLRMTERVMIDHPEMSVLECMRRSRTLMRGHRMNLFGLDLSFFGWGLLEGLTKQLSGIYSKPYHELSVCGFYEALLDEEEAKAQTGNTYTYDM